MDEIVGGLVTLFFTDRGFDRVVLVAIFITLIIYLFKNSTKRILSKYMDEHTILWKKHEEENNPELLKMKQQIIEEEKKLLNEVKHSIEQLSHNLESFKKDILHEYNQLKHQIGFIIKTSDENAIAIDDLNNKIELFEKEFNKKLHEIELKLANMH